MYNVVYFLSKPYFVTEKDKIVEKVSILTLVECRGGHWHVKLPSLSVGLNLRYFTYTWSPLSMSDVTQTNLTTTNFNF